jgi:hypothetical protein
MPPSKRARVTEAAPQVELAIESLRSRGAVRQADAVQTVLEYALNAAGQAEARSSQGGDPNVAIPIESALHLRAYEGSANLSADVLEGWQAFLSGEFVPEKPQRAAHGAGQAKSVLNVRAPQAKVAEVEAAADRMVAEKDWPTGRGYKLNARQIAVQWIARKYPAAAGESEAAAE